MKNPQILFLSLVLFMLINCSSDSDFENEEIATDQTTEGTSEQYENGTSQDPITTNLRTFIFGHSLLAHHPPLYPTPSNETTVPHWIADLSNAANYQYSVAGLHGFLTQDHYLPPTAEWSFDLAEGAWNSETTPFSEANFNSILLTAANFIQYQPVSSPYDGDNPENVTPLNATIDIFDWVEAHEPGIAIYIYENWPDMAGFLSNGIPASTSEFEAYNAHTEGEFHDWWMNYHEEVMQQRPELDVKMIPVGPIIAKLLTETELANIPFMELYEDDAPHGRPTIYFLASLVTYMAMYGTEAPANFDVPETVHELVRTNYVLTVDFIWKELNEFNDTEGNSLVF